MDSLGSSEEPPTASEIKARFHAGMEKMAKEFDAILEKDRVAFLYPLIKIAEREFNKVKRVESRDDLLDLVQRQLKGLEFFKQKIAKLEKEKESE